jgi:hypothetical protein
MFHQKKTINVSLVILARPRPRPNRSSAFAATAFASPGQVTLIPGQNLKPQVILQINRDHLGYPIFQTTSRIPTKNKEIPSAEPMKDAIATWSGA